MQTALSLFQARQTSVVLYFALAFIMSLYILTKNETANASDLPEEIDEIQSDGWIFERPREPPGQKSTYILPGDPCKECYRLNTFIKFPEEIPVDVCVLARHGFFYTGYKDRVKCFSCGSNVLDWKVFDDPRDAKWHFNQCKFVLGVETSNQPRIKKTINFIGEFTSTVHSRDSDYDVTSAPTSGASSGTKEFIMTGFAFASIPSNLHRELLTKTLNLHREEDRKKSFIGWSCFFITVTPCWLAKVGFFYLGGADRVQCFSCSGVLRNWKEGDDVDQQHMTHFRHCKMVLRTERRNIPLPNALRKAAVRKPPAPVEPADPSLQELESLKRQFPCSFPVNPHMRNFEDRLLTFDHRWPKQKVNACRRHISKAGFFFLGDRDRAKCWYCNGGLQNWEPNDEPFTEHAKWFPGCEYILQCKGVDFVKRIVAKTPNLNRPTLRHPRFDHRTGKLVSLNVHPDQQQPVIIDPRANVSAGSVLRNHSTSTSSSGSKNSAMVNGANHSQSESANTEIENLAIGMGFDKAQIKRVIERQMRNNGSAFDDAIQLIDALIEEPSGSVDIPPPAAPAPEASVEVDGFRGNQCMQVDLKRNNETPEEQNKNSTEGEESPLKKTKTDSP